MSSNSDFLFFVGAGCSHPALPNAYVPIRMVIISLEEYESMKETIELLTKNPKLPKELKNERKKIEKGDYISFEDFKKKYKIKR